MSRRNSKEEKARRRLENAWKKDRYVPIPTPEEYIKHFGFVPNDAFFYNSAIAGDLNGQDFAFRTKTQLLDYALKAFGDGLESKRQNVHIEKQKMTSSLKLLLV